MTLTGKAAKDFVDAASRDESQRRADMLARAKVEATARGKEPFDLAKLETLVDPGRMVRADLRQREYEYMYYVSNPNFMALVELADLIKVLSEY